MTSLYDGYENPDLAYDRRREDAAAARHRNATKARRVQDSGGLNYIALRDDEGNYKVVYGRLVGLGQTEAEAHDLVRQDMAEVKE